MDRKFAGILAMIGTTVVLVQAIRRGASFDSAAMAIIVWSFLLTGVGWILGAIAQLTIEGSVQVRLEEELAAFAAAAEPAPTDAPTQVTPAASM